jgi:UDP-glucose 4-epimerase
LPYSPKYLEKLFEKGLKGILDRVWLVTQDGEKWGFFTPFWLPVRPRTGAILIFQTVALQRFAMKQFGPEALCHRAAQMDVRRSVREPAFDSDVNVLGTIRLLENSVRHGVGKVVFASTGGAIYGEQHESPASEDHPLYPVSPYGVSKLAGERYLNNYRVQAGLPHMALRYSNVYGPRQDPHGEAGVVAIFGSNLAAGRISTINGTGEQTRDYVYVEDAARANVLALEGAVPSGAYNIGTSSETSVNQLYELLLEISGKDLPPEHGLPNPGEQLRSRVDPALAGRVIAWRSEVDLAAGLKETLRFFAAL